MAQQSGYLPNKSVEPLIAVALCAAMLVAGAADPIIRNSPDYVEALASHWLNFVAPVVAATGIIPFNRSDHLGRLQPVLRWSGLLLIVWAANGFPLDLLRVIRLIPLPIDWLGLINRGLAFVAAAIIGHLLLTKRAAPTSRRPAKWYGYAAFALALPYPIFRTIWVLGGTLGLKWSGAAGQGFAPWLACTPWLLAAALSLLLVLRQGWLPRRLLLIAGWSATAVVAMIGPAACWSIISNLMTGAGIGMIGIASWVPCVFYGSWFLWAIAAGAATRSFQLRRADHLDLPLAC